MPARGPRAGGEEPEPAVEPGGDLRHVQRVQPGGGQLDGEGQPVEATHDLGDAGQVLRPRGEPRGDGRRSLHEQQDGRIVLRRRAQRGHGAEHLAVDAQALPAGGHHRHVRASRHHRLDQRRHRFEDVLAVVEQQDHLEVAEHRGEAIVEPHARPTVDGQRGRDRFDGRVGRGGRQLDEHDGSSRPLVAEAVADLDGQPRLADPARSDERHDTVVADEGDRIADEVVAAEQGRGGDGQAVGRRPGRNRRASEQRGVLGGEAP